MTSGAPEARLSEAVARLDLGVETDLRHEDLPRELARG